MMVAAFASSRNRPPPPPPDGKVSKSAVRYRPAQHAAPKRCGTCSMFQPAGPLRLGSCTLVRGLIMAGDVCDRWAARQP